jgi:hypothetical protein
VPKGFQLAESGPGGYGAQHHTVGCAHSVQGRLRGKLPEKWYRTASQPDFHVMPVVGWLAVIDLRKTFGVELNQMPGIST